VVSDGLGREITLAAPARRIVSLAPSNTEILFSIGAGGQVVGRDELSDYPAEAVNVTSVGSVYGTINLEAIVALDPDLVLLSELNPAEQIAALENAGLTTYLVPNPLDFEDLYANLSTIGQLAGHKEEATALTAALRQRVASIEAQVVGTSPVRVYYEVDGSNPLAPWTTGRGTFQDYLVARSGGVNVVSELDGWAQISLEKLIELDPQVIVFGAGPYVPTTVESVVSRDGWQDITALAKGAIYAIDTNWIDRPGPRLVDAYEAMARAIHPEAFE
jgi:iron complex transport system substrate-binding protein